MDTIKKLNINDRLLKIIVCFYLFLLTVFLVVSHIKYKESTCLLIIVSFLNGYLFKVCINILANIKKVKKLSEEMEKLKESYKITERQS